jgi:hypothetical protein
MKKNTKKKLILAGVQVTFCILILNVERILGNGFEGVVFILQMGLAFIILFLFWYVCIYLD